MRLIDVLTSPWAIVPAKFAEIKEIYSRHLRGERIDIEAIEAKIGKPLANEPKPYQVQDGVALLPLDGVMSKKMNLFTRISGGTSMQIFGRNLRDALADPQVGSVVIMIDSPGGTVDGTHELARTVMSARTQSKPVVSWVDGMMASAAYWVGSAADAVYIGASTDTVGSIGVAMEHVDYSAYEQKLGVKTTDIYAGKYKRIASSNAPLSEEGRAYLQDQVDALYTLFVDAVAQQRGVSAEQVLKDMADGRIFIGQQAINAGLVDGASTLDELVASLAAGTYRPQRMAGAGAALVVSRNETGAGDAPQLLPTTQGDPMDREKLEKEHPELAKSIREEGFAAGLTQGREEGAAAERQRIQDVEAQSMPGHEKLVATLKFDGKTTGPEAAVQVLNAERAKVTAAGAALAADAPPAAPHAPAPDAAAAAAAAAADEESKPLEERAKVAWDKDASLRGEFVSFENYLAYEKNKANVKVLGGKK